MTEPRRWIVSSACLALAAATAGCPAASLDDPGRFDGNGGASGTDLGGDGRDSGATRGVLGEGGACPDLPQFFAATCTGSQLPQRERRGPGTRPAIARCDVAPRERDGQRRSGAPRRSIGAQREHPVPQADGEPAVRRADAPRPEAAARSDDRVRPRLDRVGRDDQRQPGEAGCRARIGRGRAARDGGRSRGRRNVLPDHDGRQRLHALLVPRRHGPERERRRVVHRIRLLRALRPRLGPPGRLRRPESQLEPVRLLFVR